MKYAEGDKVQFRAGQRYHWVGLDFDLIAEVVEGGRCSKLSLRTIQIFKGSVHDAIGKEYLLCDDGEFNKDGTIEYLEGQDRP